MGCLFVCGVIACVKFSEIRNFLKVKWEGIKGLSQTFIFVFLISVNSNSFHHKTLQRRWHDFFHLIKWKRVLKRFEFYLEIFSNSETLSNSMIFMREDKMTSSKHMKYELEVLKELNSKSHWNYFQFGIIWGFIQIIFLQK